MKSSLAAACFLILGSLAVRAGEIVALCIGNNAYVIPEDQLDTPVNDARLMHRTLCAVPGVQAEDIVLLEDAKRSQITLALRQFKARSAQAKLSLIFYSGHGVEDAPTGYDRAETFLLPVDAVIETVDDLPEKAVPLKTVLEALEGTKGAARAVILDCCRSGAPGATKSLSRAGKDISSLDESVKKALGAAALPEGTLIAFAASPGRKAAAFLKDTDTNSPFTRFISEQMSTQGGDLFSIINAASRITKQRTEKRQIPHVELRGDSSLVTDYTIRPAHPVKFTAPSVPAPVPVTTAPPAAPVKGSVLDDGKVGKGIHAKLPGEILMKFVFCPPGTFTMGSPASERERSEEENQVQVRISHGFWMGQTEVTQEQWQAVGGRNRSKFKGGDRPVENVSGAEAQTLIAELNQSVPLPVGWRYALPTEAQWEYACRAGTESAFSFGDDSRQLHLYANFADKNFTEEPWADKNQDDGVGNTTAKVGSYRPNAWGLYDMHGNVWEWCADWKGDKLSGGTDPSGPATGVFRVDRGSAWGTFPDRCRSAYRDGSEPDYRDSYLGFRVAIVQAK